MIQYWDIRTGATTIINKFIELVNNNNLLVGSQLIEDPDDNTRTLQNQMGRILFQFSSKTTRNQYLKTWEALGLIVKNNSAFKIATTLRDYNLLCLYTLLFVVQHSSDERINAYRNTIIINILFLAKVVSHKELKVKGIMKKRGWFKIEDIFKNISKYERDFSKNYEIIRLLKEQYDKKF